MAQICAGDAGIQETFEERHATTTIYRPGRAQIEILQKNRQLTNKTCIVQSDGLNDTVLELNGPLNLLVQFVFAIKDKETGELWRCDIRKHRPRNQFLIERGIFRVVPTVCRPYSASSIFLLDFDCKKKQLPPYVRSVAFLLPVEQEYPVTYGIMIELYREDKVLDYVWYQIQTHDRDTNPLECQNGIFISSIETPLPKKRMSGFLASKLGQRMLSHFQNLGDNGHHLQFNADKEKIDKWQEKSDNPRYYSDIVLAVALEKSIALFGLNKMDECLAICEDVCEKAKDSCSDNEPFLQTKAFYISSAVHRQKREFDRAHELMGRCIQFLGQVFACEETAITKYNKAALLAEKAAHQGITTEEENMAVMCFKDAVRLWQQYGRSGDNNCRCIIRTCNREIMFYLKATRLAFPDLTTDVTEENIGKAYDVIKKVEDNYWPFCPKRLKATFLIGKADYFIRRATSKAPFVEAERRGYLKEAISVLETARKISRELELAKETEGINHRINEILNLLQHGLEQYIPRPQQPVAFNNHPSENETSNIDDLLMEATQYDEQNRRLENQCTQNI